jgi:hypothetical protein
LWPKKRLSLEGKQENGTKRTNGRRVFESKADVGIKGNETADKAAKEALNQVDNTYKVVKSDWSKWVKRKS